MKKIRSLAFVTLTGVLLSACGMGGESNKPVITSFTATPSTVTMPGTVTLNATVTDDSGVARVDFYRGTQLLSSDNTAPYTATDTVTKAQNGTLTYRAVAYDAYSNSAEATASVNVNITDTNEPNDSIATATTLNLNAPLEGSISGQPRDMDYFKFTATAGDMLKLTVKSVSVNPASTLDPYVMILMPDGKTILEKDDDSGAGLESEIRFNVPVTGTYTVVVTSFDIHDDLTGKVTDDKTTNTYQIALTRR